MERKPLKHSGYYTDSNFNILKLTMKQVTKIAKDHVKRLNRECKKTGYKYRYKLGGIKDCGSHWNYTIV